MHDLSNGRKVRSTIEGVWIPFPTHRLLKEGAAKTRLAPEQMQ